MEDKIFSAEEVQAAVDGLEHQWMKDELEGKIGSVLTLDGDNRQPDGKHKGKPESRGAFTDVLMDEYSIESRIIGDALVNALSYQE